MNTDNAETWLIAAVILLALVAAVWLIRRELRRRQSLRLQQRFGPEYARVISERSDRSNSRGRTAGARRAGRAAQTAATDPRRMQPSSLNPGVFCKRDSSTTRAGAVVEADRLVRDLMVKRGYPMADFDRRAADISVDHPTVVETYRSARGIAVRDQKGQASTEELRKAVMYYRTLFDELLEVRHPRQTSANNTEVVHT